MCGRASGPRSAGSSCSAVDARRRERHFEVSLVDISLDVDWSCSYNAGIVDGNSWLCGS